ncbi:PP2C family protein-serine/threonine phosphatase [uncultured Hymenobacter sp.]|uniref:PP2C family protein-serine/threonine phosphatase n=1 Tax=uncultured Hymenobacter sp. TaxID=170016 RepID=UPI0035C9E805
MLSWLLLLLSTLSRTGAGAALGGAWPAWTTLAAQALLVLSIFIYVRQQPSPLREQNFLALLRGLGAGPGLLALASAALFTLERVVATRTPGGNLIVSNVVYTLNTGLFLLFVAHVNHSWRALVLFKSAPGVRRVWPWFELLLGLGLLLLLLDQGSGPVELVNVLLLGVLGLFGVYLSANQRWVAYLEPQQKWQAMGYELAVLGGLLLFVAYFRHSRQAPQLMVPAAQHTFLLFTAFFGALFAAAGLLVTFFNLPTAGVYEQRRAEILSLQRLTQVIQRGQTAAEIYQALLDSAVQTTRAAAAWLDVAPLAPGDSLPPPLPEDLYELPADQALTLREGLRREGLLNLDFQNNNLSRQPALAGLQLPYQSLVVLPLRTDARYYATLYLLKTEPHGFEQEDLNMLQAFTSQTVLSLENLQLAAQSLQNQSVQDELRIAAHVQESLIPKKLPTDDWFEISSHALAAKEVGGDFYDLLLLPGKRLAVLIGDVSGKGVTAAFHMAQMKGIFHSLMQPNPLAKSDRTQYPVPAQFMTQANAALTHCLEKSSFITASLFLIDYENGGFMFARAGHCHTLYYSSNQEKVEYFRSTGLGLGIIRGPGYEKHINNQFYDYAPGDVMVMYTDGIVEARGPGAEEYGEDRLMLRLEESYYRSAEDIKAFILDDLNAFTAGQPMHDDQTLLVIKFKAAHPTQPASRA